MNGLRLIIFVNLVAPHPSNGVERDLQTFCKDSAYAEKSDAGFVPRRPRGAGVGMRLVRGTRNPLREPDDARAGDSLRSARASGPGRFQGRRPLRDPKDVGPGYTQGGSEGAGLEAAHR